MGSEDDSGTVVHVDDNNQAGLGTLGLISIVLNAIIFISEAAPIPVLVKIVWASIDAAILGYFCRAYRFQEENRPSPMPQLAVLLVLIEAVKALYAAFSFTMLGQQLGVFVIFLFIGFPLMFYYAIRIAIKMESKVGALSVETRRVLEGYYLVVFWIVAAAFGYLIISYHARGF